MGRGIYKISDEQKKIILQNVGKEYTVIAKLALCSRSAVYQTLKAAKLTWRDLNLLSPKKEVVYEQPKKMVRPPAQYSNKQYIY